MRVVAVALHRYALILVAAGSTACGTAPRTVPEHPSTLLISFDGFRWDYLDSVPTPNFDRIIATGAHIKRLVPVFPTETFPNHYTLVTGLRPERHGIISNNMYDPAFDAYFSLGDNPENQKPRWWGGEPVWVTAMRAGRRASSFFWPGSDVVIQGHIPEPWHRFDENVSYETRWRTAVEWLNQPADTRPHLVTLYFELLDNAGHFNGPHANATRQAVQEADGYVGQILEALDVGGVLEHVNVVVTGDHGMADVDQQQVVFLDDHVDLQQIDVVHWTPVLAVNPDPLPAPAFLDSLDGVPGIGLYAKEETPGHWNYRDHSRITQVVGVADPGWTITSRPFYERNGRRVNPGAHGYDPQLTDMHTTLFAMGPGIEAGARIESVANIHVYELLCSLLGVEPAPNDGSLDSVRTLIRFP